jgi:hypothetical protein
LAGDEHVLLSGWPIVCAINGGVSYLLVRILIGRGGAVPFVVLMAIVHPALALIPIVPCLPRSPLATIGALVIASAMARLPDAEHHKPSTT